MATASIPTMRLAGNGRPITQRINFTVHSLSRLTIPADKPDRWVYDTKVIGLAYRLMRSGAAAFYLYRRIGGKPSKVRLGGKELTIDQGRKLAAKANAKVADGGDPMAVKRAVRGAETLQQLWDRYKSGRLEVHCRPKTIEGAESLWRTCLEPWASRGMLSIGEGDVRRLHSRIGSDRGHYTANRAIELLRAMYRWAKIKPNPVGDEASKWMFDEVHRTRRLSVAEMQEFLKAIDSPAINTDVADIVKLSLFTGARRGNCQAARAEEFDTDAAVWRIPHFKSKNKSEMPVPLVSQAVEIVKRRLGHPSGFLFPALSASGHRESIKSDWTSLLELAGLSEFHFHDLRRSLASLMSDQGVNTAIIGKILGHKDPRSTMVYVNSDAEVVRAGAAGAVDAMMAAKAMPAPKKQTKKKAGAK